MRSDRLYIHLLRLSEKSIMKLVTIHSESTRTMIIGFLLTLRSTILEENISQLTSSYFFTSPSWDFIFNAFGTLIQSQ